MKKELTPSDGLKSAGKMQISSKKKFATRIATAMLFAMFVCFGRFTEANAQIMEVLSNVPDKVFIGRNGTGTSYCFLGFGQGATSGTNVGMWHIGINSNVFGIGRTSNNVTTVPDFTALVDRALSIKPNGTVGINKWDPPSTVNNVANYKLYVDGNIHASGVLTQSDRRYKQDIKPISNLDNLFKINSVQYKYSDEGEKLKLELFKQKNRSTMEEERYNAIVSHFKNQIAEKEADTTTQFGFIAQELREIYPNLVVEDEQGFLSVNYTGLIPVLVDAVKELKAEIDAMKGFEKQNAQVVSSAKLYQNNPNPFTESTEIKYYIPEESRNAALCIYDMVGGQIMKLDNLGRGYSSVTLQGSQLKAGMYMYSLIVDGKEIDVKRMILTDK